MKRQHSEIVESSNSITNRDNHNGSLDYYKIKGSQHINKRFRMAEEDHPCCSASDAQANTIVTAESPSSSSEGEDRDMHDFLQQQHQRLDEQENVSATATFSPKDLNVLNLLAHPVWIFDISSKSMYWGNVEALKLWSAKSLKELLERNFASDMSESTYVRLQDYLKRFAKGEKIEDQWTMYPNFGKDGPKTIQCSMSGIQIETSSSSGTGNAYRLAMLVEAVYVETPTDSKEKEASDSLLRGLETLRHLPVVVRQFDLEGNLMDQNPEAIKLFGPELRNRDGDEQQDAGDTSLDTDTTQQQQQPLCEFLQCFEDLELGKSVLREVATHGNDYHLEAKQRTRISSNNASSQEDGMKWFSIKVRRVRDPVTSKPVLIYSARDVSTIMLKAQEEADKITSSKNEFFAVMAHEIRTPLHQVVGFIELLSRTTLDKEQYEFCSMLQSSTHALMAIINDLLDFTKLEAGKISLEKIPFEVRAVIDGCVAAMAPQAESKGVTLSSEIEHGIPVKLVGDPNRTRQIVLNMVQNAVKFTNGGPSGKVHIQASRIMRSSDAESGEEENAVLLRVEVQDTGIGISEDHLGRIFNPYQQADASVSRNYGGTGLGLAICDSLVQNMGGKIGVDSELGKGTKFWFEIPLQEHTRKQSNKSEQGISGADSERINNIGSEPTNVKLPKSSSGNKIMCQDEKKGADEVKGLRILVAEDNKVNQKVAGAMLKRLGHIPIIVENGQLAVDEIENHDRDYFDLVLMDIQMPVMDGIDATKEIRSKGFLESELPVVALTASIQSVDWIHCGMNDYIKKPVRLVELKQSLEKHAAGRTKRTEKSLSIEDAGRDEKKANQQQSSSESPPPHNLHSGKEQPEKVASASAVPVSHSLVKPKGFAVETTRRSTQCSQVG